MKPTELRRFLEEVLTAEGAEVVESKAHLLRVRGSQDLEQRLGAAELSLAFNSKGLEADRTSELATVGNPVFDRILSLAADQGRVGVRYAPIPAKPRRSDPKVGLSMAAGRNLGPPRDSYYPVFFQLFKVEWSVEEAPDTLEIVPVDGHSLDANRPSPDLATLWQGLDPDPAPGREVPDALPVSDDVLQAGLWALEKRLRRRLGRLRRDAEAHLTAEQDSIANYYRQLIEETRSSKRRYAGGAEAREEKIRILQLDWKRRMEETRESWRPRVEVELTGVGVVYQPSLAFSVLGDKETAGEVVHLDLTTGLFLLPPGARGVTLLG